MKRANRPGRVRARRERVLAQREEELARYEDGSFLKRYEPRNVEHSRTGARAGSGDWKQDKVNRARQDVANLRAKFDTNVSANVDVDNDGDTE